MKFYKLFVTISLILMVFNGISCKDATDDGNNNDQNVTAIIYMPNRNVQNAISDKINMATSYDFSVRKNGNEIFSNIVDPSIPFIELELEKSEYTFVLELLENDSSLGASVIVSNISSSNDTVELMNLNNGNTNNSQIDLSKGRYVLINDEYNAEGIQYIFNLSVRSNKKHEIDLNINFFSSSSGNINIDKLYVDENSHPTYGLSPLGSSLLSGGLPMGIRFPFSDPALFNEPIDDVYNGKPVKKITFFQEATVIDTPNGRSAYNTTSGINGFVLFGIDPASGYGYPVFYESTQNGIVQIIEFDEPVYIGNTVYCPIKKNGTDERYTYETYTLNSLNNGLTYILTIENWTKTGEDTVVNDSYIGTFQWCNYD